MIKTYTTYFEILEKVTNTPGVVVTYSDSSKEIIIAEILNYEASKEVGSSKWCISSSFYWGVPGIVYWNRYVGNHPHHKQFFVWNLKLSPELQLVGTTTDINTNKFYCAYNYLNRSFDMERYCVEYEIDRDFFFKS